jgi:hypothetical protein
MSIKVIKSSFLFFLFFSKIVIYRYLSEINSMDFCYMIKTYDILIFVETKTDEFDEIKLPNVCSYHGNMDKI